MTKIHAQRPGSGQDDWLKAADIFARQEPGEEDDEDDEDEQSGDEEDEDEDTDAGYSE